MKLFVWKDILCDNTCGVAFALADTDEQARSLILQESEEWEKDLLVRELSDAPDVYEAPIGIHVWGGG